MLREGGNSPLSELMVLRRLHPRRNRDGHFLSIHATASTFCAGWDSCIAVRKTSSALKNVYCRGVSVIRSARMYSPGVLGHRSPSSGCGKPRIRVSAQRNIFLYARRGRCPQLRRLSEKPAAVGTAGRGRFGMHSILCTMAGPFCLSSQAIPRTPCLELLERHPGDPVSGLPLNRRLGDLTGRSRSQGRTMPPLATALFSRQGASFEPNPLPAGPSRPMEVGEVGLKSGIALLRRVFENRRETWNRFGGKHPP